MPYKHLLLLLFLFATATVCAQTESTESFEPKTPLAKKSIKTSKFGLGIPILPIYKDAYKSYNLPVNLSFKHGVNNHFFRSGISTAIESPFRSFVLNAGYEYKIGQRKIQPFAGADIGYYFSNDRYAVESIYGIGPVIGIGYSPHKRFSLETEFGMLIGKYLSGRDGGVVFVGHRLLSIGAYYTLK